MALPILFLPRSDLEDPEVSVAAAATATSPVVAGVARYPVTETNPKKVDADKAGAGLDGAELDGPGFRQPAPIS
ncbi:MAG: hypothetical protein AB1486_15095 [Planctomycetota bacterium]